MSEPLTECEATGKPGPCKTAFEQPSANGKQPDAQPDPVMGRLAHPAGWPVADSPGFLDKPGEGGKSKRDQWVETFHLAAARPEDPAFLDPLGLDMEHIAASALGTPPSDVLFDERTRATILIGNETQQGRRGVLAIVRAVGGGSVRAMRINPRRKKRVAVDLDDDTPDDERRYVFARLAGKPANPEAAARYGAKYADMNRSLDDAD